MAPIMSSGVQIGWGGSCKHHSNIRDAPSTQCKRQLPYGGLSDNECKRRVQQWLLEGTEISEECHDAQDRHMAIKPRELVLMPEAEIASVLATVT